MPQKIKASLKIIYKDFEKNTILLKLTIIFLAAYGNKLFDKEKGLSITPAAI